MGMLVWLGDNCVLIVWIFSPMNSLRYIAFTFSLVIFSHSSGNTSYSSLTSSALRSSNRRSMKKTARRLITSADKIMDAPYIQDDYCK